MQEVRFCRYVLVYVLLYATIGLGQEEPPSPRRPAKIAWLIQDLAHDDHIVRALAFEKLAERGLEAQYALLEALEHPDAEVRKQSRVLLRTLGPQSLEKRLERIATGDVGESSFPGWDRFAEIVGSGPAARKLFVDMVRAEPALFAALEAGPTWAAHALETRLQMVPLDARHANGQRKPVEFATLAAIIFMASDRSLPLSQIALDHFTFQRISRQTALNSELSDTAKSKLAKSILNAWLKQRCGISGLREKLQLIREHGLTGGMSLAVAVASDRNQGNTMLLYYRPEAVAIIAERGGGRYLKVLDGLLDHDTPTRGRYVKNDQGMRVMQNGQLRDVALAWLLKMTKQSFDDYQLEYADNYFTVRGRTRSITSSNLPAFASDKDRQQAIKKWRQWVAEHPLPAAPEVRPDPTDMLLPMVLQLEPQTDGQAARIAEHQSIERLRTAQLAMERDDHVQAAIKLGALLADPRNQVFRESMDQYWYTAIRAEAFSLIASLNARGRQHYELAYGHTARLGLTAAIEARDQAKLEEISSRYYFTQAGTRATLALASLHADEGELQRAVMLLKRLQQSAWNTGLEPQLSIQLAHYLIKLGHVEESELVLDAAASQYPNEAVMLGGERFELSPADIGELLATGIRAPRHEWAMLGGSPRRNPVTTLHPRPALRGRLLTGTVDLDLHGETIESLAASHRISHRVRIPSTMPAVHGDAVFVRTVSDLYRFDLQSGEMQWGIKLRGAISDHLQVGTDEHRRRVASALEEVLWDHLEIGSVTTDGQRVYALENTRCTAYGSVTREVVISNGARTVDGSALGTHNTLSAYSAENGKLLWELGGPRGDTAIPLDGCRFFGPPLCTGDRLYVLGLRNQAIMLYEIDAQRGQPVWEFELERPETNSRYLVRGFQYTFAGQLRENQFPLPVYDDGLLICATSPTSFVGIDLVTRKVRWEFQIEPPITGRRVPMPVPTTGREQPGWQIPSMVMDRGRLYVAAHRTHDLYCLDAATGKTYWTQTMPAGMYLAGVTDQTVLAVGRSALRAFRVTDGQAMWNPSGIDFPGQAHPAGIGYVDDRFVNIPLTTDELLVVDHHAGKIQAVVRSRTAVRPSNLVPCPENVITASEMSVVQLASVPHLLERLENQLEKTPEDISVRLDYAAALLDAGEVNRVLDVIDAIPESSRAQQWNVTLGHALLMGLLRSPDEFLARARNFDPEQLSVEDQVRFLRALAVALENENDRVNAFEAILRIAKVPVQNWGQVRYFDEDYQSSAEQQLLADLRRLFMSASADDQVAMTVAAAQSQQKTIDRFFDLHLAPKSRQLFRQSLDQYEQQLKEGDRLGAERRLLALAMQTDLPQAYAHLAKLYVDSARPSSAAAVYRYLQTRYQNQPVSDGKSTADLIAGVPAEHPLHQLLRETPQWGDLKGEPQLETTTKSPIPTPLLQLARSPSRIQWPCELVTRGSNLTLTDPNGHPIATAGLTRNLRNGIGVQAMLSGHLAIIRTSSQIVGVDMLSDSPRQIWSYRVRNPAPFQMGVPVGLGANGARAQTNYRPLPAVVTPDAICVLSGQQLTGLDPANGKTMWIRTDCPLNSILFGDHKVLCLLPQGQSEVWLLDPFSGELLARHPLPMVGTAAGTYGSHLLIQSPSGDRVMSIDAASGKVHWMTQRRVTRNVHQNQQLVALYASDGQLQLRAIDSPAVVFTASIRLEEPLVEIRFREDGRGYDFLLMTESPRVTSARGSMLSTSGKYLRLSDSGKRIWETDLQQEKHYIAFEGPANLPILTMLERLQTSPRRYALRCYDKRSGKLVHEHQQEGLPPFVQITPDVDSLSIQLTFSRNRLTMQFDGSQ